MAEVIAGFLAICLMAMHKAFNDDPLSGMASALFWMVFAGACFIVSAGDVSDIFFYLFLAGIGMIFAMLLEVLVFSPSRQKKKENIEDKTVEVTENRLGFADRTRQKLGLRKLEKNR
jgi:hypothetical protein